MSARRKRAAAPYLLDTHVWFWYLTGSQRLPVSLRRAIDGSPGEIWLSPISVWELGMLDARGRVRLEGGDVRAWVDEAERRFPVQDAPLNREVALVSGELRLPHRDPADRFIAATALVHDLTVLTVDARLTAATWLRTKSS